MTKPDTNSLAENDFDAIAKNELDQVILEFTGWCDGFVHGARLSEEPHIFARVKCCLFDLQAIYNKKAQLTEY